MTPSVTPAWYARGMADKKDRKPMTKDEVPVWAMAAAAVLSRPSAEVPGRAAALADSLIDELRERLPPGKLWFA